MKLGRIGVASVIMALLIPIIGIDNSIMQEIAFYMIVIGMILIGISMQIKINKDLK